jgi:hypothetical protein
MGARLLAVAMALSGCTSLAPLHEYNDKWYGELSLPGGAEVVRVSIYILAADRAASEGSPFGIKTLGEVRLGDGPPVAALGDVSHYEYTDIGRDVYSPIPDREFVKLEVVGLGMIANTGEQPEAAAKYRDAHEALIDLAHGGPIAIEESGDLELIAERQGDRLEGIAVLTVSREGECTHRGEDGKCDAWDVISDRRIVGEVSLERDGARSPRIHKSPGLIETGAFAFERTGDEWSTSWTLRLKPQLQ